MNPRLARLQTCPFDKLQGLLAGTLDGLSVYPRRGLQRDYNVLVLPGSFLAREAHGENSGKNHVRIALVASLEECVEAVGRIMQFAKAL